MKKTTLSMFITIVVMISYVPAFAEHPAYMKALADLRAVRWLIDRPEHKQFVEEGNALREIDAAINEIKKAGIDDHKDIKDHGTQEIPDNRLREAARLLRKIRSEIERGEDDRYNNGLRTREFRHIDEAIRNLEHVMR